MQKERAARRLKDSARALKRTSEENAMNPIPEGYHAVTPHLIIRDAARALDFYREALGADELFRLPGPDGRLMHASNRWRATRSKRSKHLIVRTEHYVQFEDPGVVIRAIREVVLMISP
jgi:hypothetical protein